GAMGWPWRDGVVAITAIQTTENRRMRNVAGALSWLPFTARGAHHVETELLQHPHDGAEAGPARPLSLHGPQRVQQRRREAAGQEGGHRRLRRAGPEPGPQHARLGPGRQLRAAP